MRQYIAGLDAAMKFASENNFRPEDIEKLKSKRSHLTDKNLDKNLEVKDFCHIVEVYVMDESDGHKYCDYVTHGLMIDSTEEIFNFYQPQGQHRRYALAEFQPVAGRTKGFEEENIERPNFIGTATKKKIMDWVEYLLTVRQQLQKYMLKAMAANKEFVSKFRAKYPDAYYKTEYDGWVSQFTIISGPIEYTYWSHPNGSFSRTCAVYYLGLPSTEDLLK